MCRLGRSIGSSGSAKNGGDSAPDVAVCPCRYCRAMACNPTPLPDIAVHGLTPEVARAHLKAWVEASQKLSLNQSYRIGDRELRRADLGEVRRMITYWRDEAKSLEISARDCGRRTKVLRHGW